MTSRPNAEERVSFLAEDLSPRYALHTGDKCWTLDSLATGRRVYLDFTLEEFESYVAAFENRAFDVLGVEPRWKSAVSAG